MNSPIFPPVLLTATEDNNERSFIPTLPLKPLVATGSLQVFVIPAEKNLFVEGFLTAEYGDRPPTLLRGCLYVRVLKPTKIKTICLKFKGIQRTDWPEGIPPKKNNFAEVNDIVNHTWPFYNQLQGPVVNGGADHYQELPKCSTGGNGTEVDISHLSLSETQARSISPLPRGVADANVGAAAAGFGEFFARTISLSPVAAGIIRKATTSNAPSGRSLSPSPSNNSLASMAPNDLHAVTTDSGSGQFNPGDYIYNFEHPVPSSTPESVKVTFGEVSYHLDVSITRPGTFKLNLLGRLPINVVRIPSEDNLEENEPIVISRDWEDQLKYEIVIGSKSVVLDSYLPLAFRFIPLFGKVALHRIRVYLSENLEYYCNNKKVHRMEPPKKFLLLEHKALKGKSLLSKAGGLDPDGTDIPLTLDEEDEILPRELEFQVFVPHKLQDRTNHTIHPDTSFEVIQAHHWIKICLRISRFDPENPEKRKHYEIRIDSPINILSPLCVRANTLLPEYNEIDASSIPNHNVLSIDPTTTPPVSPGVIPVGGGGVLNNNFLQTNSLDALMDDSGRTGRSFLTEANGNRSRSRSNSSSVRTFQHIQTSGSQDEPIERDYDMHLESNLYKPKDEGESIYHSPQAMPFESPVGSPIQRPIHLLRKPSINPPTFDLISGPPLMTYLPPEYEEEDSGIHRNDSQVFEEEANTTVNEELEVKEEHLLRGRRRTQTEGENIVDGVPSKTISTEESAFSFKVTQPSPTIERLPQQLPHAPNQVTTSIDDAISAQVTEEDLEQDIVDEFKSVHGPVALNPENFNLLPKLRASGSRSRSTSPSRVNGDQRYSYDSSRRSSIASTNSLNSSVGTAPLIERTPLLNESSASLEQTTSLTSQFNVPGRNTSIISLLQSHGVLTSSIPASSGITAKKMSFGLADINDDNYKVNGNLLLLRNPRIKKHYQDSELANGSDEEFEPTTITQKSRQKSFGVVNMSHNTTNNNSNSNSNSSESDNTSTEDAEQSTTTFKYKEETPQNVTGLNLNYIIE